ncbi:hypothetical protein Ahy_A10g050589 [Arachis hypogaea]|uniref:Uncharacterized protein n=1 Tax=Arachis hypogaea TaxID=3818 RepID=A0A445B9U0_ARAHY|nr:hypothetical protein Ahy_A10g050589 [Arachis hypogaea]
MVVASPSFVVDLNRSGDGEVGIIDRVPISLQRGAPNGIDNALPDDDDADDLEPDIIVDDNSAISDGYDADDVDALAMATLKA